MFLYRINVVFDGLLYYGLYFTTLTNRIYKKLQNRILILSLLISSALLYRNYIGHKSSLQNALIYTMQGIRRVPEHLNIIDL